MWLLDFIKTTLEHARKEEISILKERNKRMITIAFDSYSDLFIKEISWNPLKPGWASFKTNSLINKPNWNYQYVVSIGTKLFAWYFLVFSLMWLFSLFSWYQQEVGRWHPFDNDTIIAFLFFPVIFSLFWLLIYTKFSKRKFFDLANSCLYIWKQTISFSDIYAIQLLREYVNWNKSNYNSYELNLILKNKSRINVIDHWKVEFVRKDALVIWWFIWVPVWDLTKAKSNQHY